MSQQCQSVAPRRLGRWAVWVAALVLLGPAARAQRQMENLDRGLVAINQGGGNVYVGWRLLGTEPGEMAFNLYRVAGSGAAVKLNPQPITQSTNYVDTGMNATVANAYFVRPVLNGVELADSRRYVLPAGAAVQPYLSIPLAVPAGGTTPDGVNYTYSPNDCSVGDLDGDGEYEIVVKWDPSNAKDNSQSGYTGNVYLDAYKLDGTRLWRIDFGRNIRAGAHYTQFMVYDLDGDGQAEIACKTGDGTIDGRGRVIGDATADYRNSAGYVLAGPEFLTLFAGPTGAALTTIDYLPARGRVTDWGDNYGNRVDRFLAGIAYLDGQRPSLVMCRGYYTRAVLAAWNWRDGQLSRVWTFDSDDGTPGNSAYRGQGNHQVSVGDVDDDGRDEIIYGSCAIDDNGKGLHVTGLSHGDAMHLSDLDPTRPGLEVWQCHEDWANNGGVGLSFRDARTGARLWTVPNTTDTGRAVAIDLDPRYPGYECWGAVGGLYTARGVQISTRKPASTNFAVWWDGDLLREILDSNRITKWNWSDSSETRLLTADNCTSNNGTKSTPCLSADILGDWREEVILRTTDNRELRIYTTTIPTDRRLYTLMHDPQYRLAVAWQNVVYNQPPHPGFFLGDGMDRPPTPVITTPVAAGSSRLANFSVRTAAGGGEDTLIAGFVVAGAGQQTILLRGVGPSLRALDVAAPMSDPKLLLYSGQTMIDTNDNWTAAGDADKITAMAASLGAFPLLPSSRDAVLLPNVGAGTYSAHVTAATGAAGIALAEIYVPASSSSVRIINASARARAGSGENTLIAGFVIEGSASRTVLVRAVGPGLVPLGVTTAMADPWMALFRGGARLAENDDWGAGSGATAATFAVAGAFPLPAGSKDAALVLTLPPGPYTVQAVGAGAASGVILIEIYDLGG